MLVTSRAHLIDGVIARSDRDPGNRSPAYATILINPLAPTNNSIQTEQFSAWCHHQQQLAANGHGRPPTAVLFRIVDEISERHSEVFHKIILRGADARIAPVAELDLIAAPWPRRPGRSRPAASSTSGEIA
jgi:hypothetical protein